MFSNAGYFPFSSNPTGRIIHASTSDPSADVATKRSGSLNVRLAVTDRRLLWLRDDAIVDRVRRLPYTAIERIEARMARRRHRGELRVHGRDGRRMSFAEMRAELLRDALWVIEPRLRAPRPA